MSEAHKHLERQAAWQKGREVLTWPEKVRMAEAVREWAAQLRRARLQSEQSASAQNRPRPREAEASEEQE